MVPPAKSEPMWPFHSFSTANPQETHRALEARLDQVESQIRILRTEWEEMYDKIVRRMERERKRRNVEINTDPEEKSVSLPFQGDGNLSHAEITLLARQKGFLK